MSDTTTATGTREANADRRKADNRSRIEASSNLGTLDTLRRGIQLSPELLHGIGWTLLLAVLAATGRIVVPLTVQHVIDDGILADGGPDGGRIAVTITVAVLALSLAALCSAMVNVRLVRRAEAGLASLRIRAFRHIHDLSALTQNTERRGALLSRVTSDIDTISQFVSFGGIMLVVSSLQLAVATVLMVRFSWALALVVWGCFIPLYLLLRLGAPYVRGRFMRVRERTGLLLGAMSEAVVGAETVRAYGIAARTTRRIDAAIEDTRVSQGRAWILGSTMFSAGTLVANLTLAVVLMVGAHLGVRGVLTAGTVVAFLFLVQLFTGPVQLAAEILNDLHNAVAGWGRVIAIVDTPADVVDARDARQSPRGPAQVSFQGVHFAYPGGADVLHGIDIDLPAQARVAVVGHTGSGKTTLAKLATRLMDPTRGAVLLDGVDLRELAVDSLRRRVVLVPQEGFLFDGTIADNVAYALRTPETPDRSEGLRGHDPHSRETRARLLDVFTTLGLADWLADLPAGLDTPVGQRGESLSAGERQLVAIVRAALAEPDLLVLDEATSAVDPATEVRIARALERLTAHRSTLTIAHRLSTAEASDLVLVVDQGNLVEVGTHTDLVAAGGIYATMHAAWVAQTT